MYAANEKNPNDQLIKLAAVKAEQIKIESAPQNNCRWYTLEKLEKDLHIPEITMIKAP